MFNLRRQCSFAALLAEVAQSTTVDLVNDASMLMSATSSVL